jgi:leader peptidase (prepilin peptidase)/N-methyltransferase
MRIWVTQFIMVIGLMVFYFFPPIRLGFWLAALVFLYFMVVAVIDLEHKAILIPTTIFGLFLALFTGWSIHGLGVALLGGVAGGAIMAGLYFFGIFFIRMMEKAKKQQIEETALGEGDVYLMVVLGLMMGWPEVVGGLILGILSAGLLSGGLVLGSLLFKRYKALTAIPYAPFLLLGAFIMIFLARK